MLAEEGGKDTTYFADKRKVSIHQIHYTSNILIIICTEYNSQLLVFVIDLPCIEYTCKVYEKILKGALCSVSESICHILIV